MYTPRAARNSSWPVAATARTELAIAATALANRQMFWQQGEPNILRWTVIFLIIAIVAGIFGFAGVIVAAAGIAKLLFYLFLILFLITLIASMVNKA